MATVTTPRIRPYRRYLTSVFHRRFVQASTLTLLLCYVEAILLGSSRSFLWSWFPIGPTGLRALCLCICCLAVFILRISQLKTGWRSTPSPITTLHQVVLRPNIIQVVLWYLVSAWWFSELYIWLSPASADLGWVHHESLRKRDKLNERPIYLRSVYLQLAVVQIASHIYRGLDNIRIPSTRPSLKSTDQRTHQIAPIPAQIKQKAPELLVLSALLSLATVFPSPFVYAGLLRGIYWSTHMAFAKLFYNIPRSNANYEGFPPCSPPMLLRAFFSGFCLLVLWESSNILFSALLAQEPIKKDQPLSAESKDPNGTLLSGLKAKKDTVKTFALWELVYISQKLPDRRKAIFADIERSGGPTWTQMLQASLSVVKAIEDRVKASQAPAQTAQVTRDSTAPYPSIQSLPHIAPDVKSSDSIFASSPPPQTKGEKLQSTVEPLVRSLGQSPHWTPSAKERVKGLLEYPGKKSTELTDASRTTSNPSFLPGPLQYYAKAFLRSHAGYPFRHTFPRVLSSIILASPNAQTAQIVDAVESITRMLVASLSEDLYGKAQSTVPETVRTFTSTIKAIEDLIDTMTPHWTDVEYETKGARVGEEVEVVLERLKGGLDELLGAFQLYLREVGLSDADFKAAKEAVRRKERKRPVAQSQPQVSSNEKPNNENIQKALPPKNGDKRSSAGGERPPRKRLEERDRGKDLEFLTALPPQQEKEKGKTDEGQKSKKALPPPEKEHEGPFAFVQRKDIHREIEQVRR